MIIKLPERYKYESYEIEEIDLDMARKITPKTIEMLTSRHQREILAPNRAKMDNELWGMYNTRPELDPKFHRLAFEFITGMPWVVICNDTFPIKEYGTIKDALSYFFMNWEEPYVANTDEQEMEEAPTTFEDITGEITHEA